MKDNKREIDLIYDELDQMSEEELNREMEKILAEVDADEELANVEVPKGLFEAVSKEIQQIENQKARDNLSEEDKELLYYGKLYKRQMKKRKYLVLAAILVLSLAVGMTSMGGPRKLLQKVTGTLSGREQEMVDANDGSISNTTGWTEEEAYAEIEKKFGFRPVKLDYLPKDVGFEEMLMEYDIQGAQLLYFKDDKVSLRIYIQTNNRTGSHGFDIEDIEVQTYAIQKQQCEICITEYVVEKTKEIRWTATFEDNEVFYYIMGFDMIQEEFERIINNLIFV